MAAKKKKKKAAYWSRKSLKTDSIMAYFGPPKKPNCVA